MHHHLYNLHAAPILLCRRCNWVVSLPVGDPYMGSVALIFYFPNYVLIEADADGNGHVTYDYAVLDILLYL